MGSPDMAARNQTDFGPWQTVNVCLYLDEGITPDAGRKLVEDAWRSEAPLYALDVKIVDVRSWKRPAFDMTGIIDSLRQEPLEAPCDRILALVGRNIGDALWGLLAPEVLGAVNDETLTHGYVVARRATLNQLFLSPTDTARHEIYHLLGCGEHFNMTHCYQKIARLKEWKRQHAADFFPAWDLINQRMVVSRNDVNARLADVNGAVAQR
jgi:hypothetical protein